MKNAHCFEAGTLELGTRNRTNRDGFDTSGALAAYEFMTAESMHKTAASYAWIIRPGGKKIKGSDYTTRMAANDFTN